MSTSGARRRASWAGAVRERVLRAPVVRASITVAAAVVGGMAGAASGVPGGAILGAMLAVASYNLLTDGAARLRPAVKSGSRILVGTTIGSLASASVVASIGSDLPWVIGFTAVIILVGLVCGWLLSRMTDLDVTTSLLASVPGGLAEMASLAESLGARAEIVVGLHVLRKVLALVVLLGLVGLVGR